MVGDHSNPKEVCMSCPFCEAFACYERQIGQRLETGTFAMSEENAHLLVCLAVQIRNLTRTTLRQVDHEVVPTMLCDLLDGLAEGLIEGLDDKLGLTTRQNCSSASSGAKGPIANGERAVCAPNRASYSFAQPRTLHNCRLSALEKPTGLTDRLGQNFSRGYEVRLPPAAPAHGIYWRHARGTTTREHPASPRENGRQSESTCHN